MPDFLPMVHTERRSLAAFLDTLTPEQWNAPTWCPKWSVQDLVGHLTAAGNMTAPHFFGGFIRSGFKFDRFVEGDLRQYSAGTPAEARRRFDAIIESNNKPPAPAYVALGEVMVHGEDIRRPLGARGDHEPAILTTLAEAYKKAGAPVRAKTRLVGLRLVANDVDWSTGDGPEVRGPCMSLILAMAGRTAALDDCEGPGVGTLRSRGAAAG